MINPDDIIKSFWFDTLGPYLLKNFPITKVGIFTTNADVHILIQQIEAIIKKKKEKEKEKESDINNKYHKSDTISSISTCDSFVSFKNNNISLTEKNNLKNNIDIIIENEEEFDKNEINNDKINNNEINNDKTNNNEINKNEVNNNKINNNEINNNEINNNEIKKLDIANSRINLVNERINSINENLKKSNSTSLYKEMKPNYIDRNETELKTIEHNPNKKIKLIEIDLLLKKVCENSFNAQENKILYGFIKQSFSFLDTNLFLKKMIKCYEFHKFKEKLNPKVQNLIEFFNAYVIEMFEYNKSIISDDKTKSIINSFYTKLKSDIISMIKYDNLNNNKNQVIKRKIVNEKIITSDIDKNGNFIMWWDPKLVRKKLKSFYKANLVNKSENSINEINNSFNANIKSKYLNEKDIKDIQKIKKLPRLSMAYTSYDLEFLKSNQTLGTNPKEKLHKSNSKDKNLEIQNEQKTKEVLSDEKLIKLFGNEYKEIITNKELIISKEENFLLLLKNITKLLSQDKYSEEFILRAKSRENFYNKLKEKEKIKHKNYMIESEIYSRGSSIKKKYFCVTDYKVEQIGEQLISISKRLLNQIELRELYNAIFTKKDKNIKSKNVMENIQKFNNLIFFIVEDILSYDTPKERAKIYEQWVLIAKYCKKRKDQSNCLAINSALNHYIITGLDQTLNLVKHSTKQLLKVIGDYCTLEGNYKEFREEIKNIKKDEFFLPYLGIILRDFIFFEEKGKYIIRGNMINFEKISNVQKSLDTFFEFKNRVDKVKFELNPDLIFLDYLGEKKEQDLEKLANNLEPEFKLGEMKEGIKRLTDIDKMIFGKFNKK